MGPSTQSNVVESIFPTRLPQFSLKKLGKFLRDTGQPRPDWLPPRHEIHNGAIVNRHFRQPVGRFRTYDAIDGTIRVSRIGKAFRVTPKR